MLMIQFVKTMLQLPKPWVAWVALLMGINMMVPLFFINTMEGKMVFAAGMVGALIMMLIFRAKGFVRIKVSLKLPKLVAFAHQIIFVPALKTISK